MSNVNYRQGGKPLIFPVEGETLSVVFRWAILNRQEGFPLPVIHVGAE
jgi:hypothetical protein